MSFEIFIQSIESQFRYRTQSVFRISGLYGSLLDCFRSDLYKTPQTSSSKNIHSNYTTFTKSETILTTPSNLFTRCLSDSKLPSEKTKPLKARPVRNRAAPEAPLSFSKIRNPHTRGNLRSHSVPHSVPSNFIHSHFPATSVLTRSAHTREDPPTIILAARQLSSTPG